MKRIWALLLSGICMFFSSAAYAQGKVYFQVEGRSAGSVKAVELNGITYVDVQRTARKLGANVELFAASKQAKITTKGFFAILTAPLSDVIVNGKHIPIPGEVVVNGGQLMSPAEVFLLPSFQKAVNRRIEFKDNTFWVERRYTAALEEPVLKADENLLVFDTEQDTSFETEQPNNHTVLVTMKKAVLKRDVYKRLHTDYISSADVRQVRGNVELKVILGSKAKEWSFTEESDGKLVFRAASGKAKPTVSAPQKEEPIPLPVQTVEEPSVLEDDFEEMTPAPEPAPLAVSAAEEPAKPAETPASVPAETPAAVPPAKPVVKEEPHPLAVTAHKKMRIVVDPGHGGKDAGAVRGKYREKDWNLAVSKELVKLLKKGNFEVKITRDTDVFIPLSDRSKIANTFKADLFVSVHVNATKNTKANGFQVYFRSDKPTDKEAAETAALENEAMQYEEVHYNFVDALLQSLAKNEYINESSKLAGYIKKSVYKQPGIGIAIDGNAIRQANFYVLKGVQSPAVLVEMGFISSPKDRGRLSQGSVQKKMAQGIYNGIVNYAKQEGWIK